jgi:hypothetical protein
MIPRKEGAVATGPPQPDRRLGGRDLSPPGRVIEEPGYGVRARFAHTPHHGYACSHRPLDKPQVTDHLHVRSASRAERGAVPRFDGARGVVWRWRSGPSTPHPKSRRFCEASPHIRLPRCSPTPGVDERVAPAALARVCPPARLSEAEHWEVRRWLNGAAGEPGGPERRPGIGTRHAAVVTARRKPIRGDARMTFRRRVSGREKDRRAGPRFANTV